MGQAEEYKAQVKNVRKTAILSLKIILLAFLLFVCFIFSSMIVGLTDSSQTTDPMAVTTALFVVSLLNAIVLSYPIIRSRWTGWKLVITIFFVYYGASTFLSQIETIVYLNYLVNIVPADMIPKLFLQGLITAALFSPLAVLIHGQMRKEEEINSNNQLIMHWTEWCWKLILIAIVYVTIYFSFGLFVFMPLAGSAAQEYYTNLQLPEWIFLFQALRAMIWTALALPVIRMMKGQWWEAALSVALLFSVLMGASLLIPSDIMPEAIRLAHFVEIFTSNFLFGWFIVWLLHRHHEFPLRIKK